MFSRTKTFIQVWNYLRVSKWWQNLNFWVNYPFKLFCFFDYTVVVISLQNVNNWNKIRGFMKIACYFLFSTVLDKLFHITDVYIYSTRQNNNWIYKNDPIQKFTYPWILILCVISWMIHDCFYILYMIVVHESLVCPEQFNCHFWKGFKYAEECAGAAQDQRGTHEQLSQNIKTVVDHPRNDT